MFNLFKKKGVNIVDKQSVGLPEAAFDLDKEIIIHTMPPRFRASRPGSGQAKKTGLIILIFGVLFLMALAGGAYYILFLSEPTAVPTASSTPENLMVQEEPKTEAIEPVPAAIEPITPPAASSTIIATTSPEIIATTTVVKAEPDKIKLLPATDTDNDGLTDAEETILGTSAATTDSDGDGYGDLAELNNFYDPSGPGKLAASPHWKKYLNATYNYSLLEPLIFTQKPLGGDYLMSFVAPDNQFFQVEVQPNTGRASILDWYREQFGESADTTRLLEVKDAGGETSWLGIKSEDGLAVYLTDSKLSNIFTLSYNIGLEPVVKYPNLFNIFIKSLAFSK